MANGPDHLVTEYGQLVEFLELYPNISITRTEGEPPDEYEIAYELRAYTLTGSGVQVGRQHRILISLPFGYPHFAPEVKTLTPLFHPAIDQNGIVIEEQWRRKPSLPDLVLYIAEMISGHIYAMDTPVNPEAARWYEEHKKELPLDTPSIASMEEESLVGILDEFDPALNLEEDIERLDAPDSYDAEIEEIRELIAQNYLYTLSNRLKDLPADLWFPEREEVEERVEAASKQAAALFAQAQQLEDEGRYGKALEHAQAILNLMPDEPAAKALAQRLQQSSFITDSLTDALNDQEDLGIDLGMNLDAGTQPSAPPAVQEKAAKGPRKPLLPEGFPLRTILLVILGVVALLWLGMQGMNEWDVLSRVQKGIREGQSQLQLKHYAEAKDTLERTRPLVTGLTLLWFRESALHKEIDALLNAPELKEGAQGRVLYKGKYMDEAEARALEEATQLEQKAREFAGMKDYDAALLHAQKALQRIGSLPLTQETERLNGLIHILKVERLLTTASQAEEQQKWDEAMDMYGQAESLLQADATMAQKFSAELNRRIGGLELRQIVGKAMAAMENDQLAAARIHIEEAEQKLAATPGASALDRLPLDSARVQLDMYAILPDAKKAFESKQWRQAAVQYRQALDIVAQSRPEVQSSLQGVRNKLLRALELSLLNQSLDEALAAERKKDWPLVVRLENSALARLAKLPNDPEVAELKRRLGTQLAQHKQELDLAEKGKWLEARGLDFFRTSYPTFKESSLSAPKAIFLRREGSKQIFELSSMDSSGGRPSKLVLLYAFDETTRQWGPFKE